MRLNDSAGAAVYATCKTRSSYFFEAGLEAVGRTGAGLGI